ncbi:MAG TPA: xanthine dehydrogenase family protein molybdopterin-binding subunit [Nevskia sp.]|nr:xanthine dehydrogenase family protein molybdopterin-binding subunit [Nevskia sp.]
MGFEKLIERTLPAGVSRRAFLKAGAAAGGGLLIAVGLPGLMGEAEAAEKGAEFAPNAFIRVGGDGRITLVMGQVEMGQGTYTSMPMLIAEELEVSLDQVTLEHAPPDQKAYGNPIFVVQMTGGSTSVRGFWTPLRQAGATARTMLVNAAAQRWKVDPASCRAERGTVIHPSSGRKLKYGALADAAAGLPLPEKVALKDPKDFKLIGTPHKRLDSPDKLNGKAKFGIDTQVPGMKIATVAACPVFGGKVAKYDEAAAKAVKGVRQVVAIDNAVAVVADHMWAAKQGLAALNLQWDEGPNAKLSTADIVAQMAKAAEQSGIVAASSGDVAKAGAAAPVKVDAVYQVPFLAHATMEPMNCTVHYTKDACEIWTGTQVIGLAQLFASKASGLPPEKITVHNHLLGGGFGRRLESDYVYQAVLIAKQVEGPVKIVWTREEDIQHDMYRPYYYDRISAALDDKGLPVAWNHRLVGPSIVDRYFPGLLKPGTPDPDAIEGAHETVYDIPNRHVEYVRYEPPGIPTAWWRGVGPTHNIFVVESFVDELAAKAGKDPVEYRRALLGKSPRALAVLNLAAEKAGWGKALPAGSGRGVSVQNVFGSYLAQVAEVEVGKDGSVKVKRLVCAVDCGYTVNPDTIRAQIEGGAIFGITAVLHGEITLKDGRVEQSNFHNYQMLRINEAPLIEVHIVPSAEAPGGIGEPGTSALAPAVLNAVYAATGKRLRKLPIDPAQLTAT